MTCITWDDVSAAIRRDYLNVLPTLILLTAVDPCFPDRRAGAHGRSFDPRRGSEATRPC